MNKQLIALALVWVFCFPHLFLQSSVRIRIKNEMKKRITILLMLAGCLFATEKTFVREHTYHTSDYDSKVTSRANAIELDSNNAYTFFHLGLAYGEDIAKAIQSFEKVIKINPYYAAAYYNLGFAYYIQGNFAIAIQMYEKTIELDPDYAKAYYNLGFAYYIQGNFAIAIQMYEKTIELNPNNVNAYYNLGNIYGALGYTQELISNFKKAARLGDEEAQGWLEKNGYNW